RYQRPSFNSNAQPNGMHASNQRRSYVSILKKGKTNPVSELNSSPALVLDESCILENDRKLSLMGKVKDFGSMPNLYFLLAKEGFYDLKLSYLGGIWVLIEFSSKDAKQKFHKHIGVGSWFTSLIQANPKFISDERVVWVDIEGIPLHARTTDTFKKIGSKWGEVLDTENSERDYEEKMDYNSSNEESVRVRLEGKIGEHEKGNSEANEIYKLLNKNKNKE
ncbi:RNA-directed DNA polymerase, eukaryota, nucleotide-binding alpha-beta plait domain protein, partial [Tanacetum coccineum]